MEDRFEERGLPVGELASRGAGGQAHVEDLAGREPADWRGLPVTGDIGTARDIVLHMIEETARHAGHLDLARELIDGRTGLGPR